MADLKARRKHQREKYTQTPGTEIELGNTQKPDPAQAEILGRLVSIHETLSSLDERVDSVDTKMTRLESRVVDTLQQVIAQGASLIEVVDRLRNTRLAMDEESLAAMTAKMTSAAAKASDAAVDRHTERLRSTLTGFMSSDMSKSIQKVLEETTPKGSGLQKAGAIFGIIAGVIVTAMAATYGYAVWNYMPPIVTVDVDGATGGATASAKGGQALRAA
jgi:hypothetical protein